MEGRPWGGYWGGHTGALIRLFFCFLRLSFLFSRGSLDTLTYVGTMNVCRILAHLGATKVSIGKSLKILGDLRKSSEHQAKFKEKQ